MKHLPLLLLALSLPLTACSKKSDKDKAPDPVAKTVDSAAALTDKAASPTPSNAKLDELAAKAEGLDDRVSELDWKADAFKKELVAALGPKTATVEDEDTTDYWLTCDASRCVGASLAVENGEVSKFNVIDDTKETGYYYGLAFLAWRTANADKALASKLSPSALEALATKIENTEGMKWDAALALLAPAGKSIKHDDSEEDLFYHAVDAKTCAAMSVFKYDDDLVDRPDVITYEAAVNPFDNDEYARCAMHAMGL
jgi:outer membrane murein-binding lipoprotein Lpp